MSDIQSEYDEQIDAVTISWSSAPSNGADIIEYIFIVLMNDEEVFQTNTSTTDITVSRDSLQDLVGELGEMAVYEVRVSARNEVGTGEEASAEFTLPAGEQLYNRYTQQNIYIWMYIIH